MSRSLIHLADYDRDELTIGRRVERDREREGPRVRRVRPSPPRRLAASTLMIEDDVVELSCPTCSGPVYAVKDSDAERIDCASCDERLVTRRAIGGEVSVALATTTTTEGSTP